APSHATNSRATQLTEIKVTNSNSARVSTNGTNATGIVGGAKGGTNLAPANALAMMNNPGGGRPGMMGMMGKPPELPAAIKERVDRITQGEILAPVMRPMPMALLGIAGPSAFLRSPEGQTGIVKEGEQVGTIKLLRIGTNRV